MHNALHSHRLFCLSFAGGSYYSYYPLEKHLDSNIQLVPVDLPGHGRRMKEPLLSDLHDMCADMYEQIKDQLDLPYAILGHSMGATLGYLLALKIEDSGYTKPIHLFASGRQGPSVPSCYEDVYQLPKPDFIKHLMLYGGIQEEVLKDKDLLELFEPILRADFKALGKFRHDDTAPIDLPVTVLLGTADTTTYEDALAWQKITTRKMDIHQFPGGHFFIFDYLQDIGRMISSTVLAQCKLSVS